MAGRRSGRPRWRPCSTAWRPSGSSPGIATPAVAAHFDVVVAVDLSLEMLRRAPDRPGARVHADGAVVWVSALGDGTPIYLPPDDVVADLPGSWEGVASEAGWGSWVVARRAGVSAR